MNSIKLKFFIASTTLVVGHLFLAATSHAAGNRPIQYTPGREIAAFFDGPQCDARVKLLLRGKSRDSYKSGQTLAAALINSVTLILRSQCPAIKVVSANGIVDGEKVYTGVADRATNWRVVEVGSGGSDLLSSGVLSSEPEKQTFSQADGFITAAVLNEMTNGAAYLCDSYQAGTNSCKNLSHLERHGDGKVTITASQYRSEDGTIASIKYASTPSAEGFICTNPQDAIITVTAGNMSKDGRAALAEDLTLRIRDRGEEVCFGYQSNDGNLTSQTFDADGYPITQIVDVTAFTVAPELRFES